MKKIASLLLVMAMVFGLAACSSGGTAPADPGQASDKTRIVCTIYPAYDWVKEIAAGAEDDCEILLLGGSGVDLHSYQPSAADIAAIASCDLVLYVGGESDEWVEDALSVDHKESRVALSLMEMLQDRVKEEEIVEGMQEEHEHDQEEGEHEEGPEYDEHVWLSLKNAEICVEKIEEVLSDLLPEKAGEFSQNAASYEAKLQDLDDRFAAAVAAAPQKMLLFGDRFPFRYLTDDYGLEYYAAFVGCSAETEASFETIIFLAQKLDELQLHTICVLENSDEKLANTIRQATASKEQAIVVFDSLQSVTMEDIQTGRTYLSAMEGNLTSLIQALE